MTDYDIKYVEDISLITVNVERATIVQAKEFKNIIDKEIQNKNSRIVVDLSSCDFIDSTFIGVLVVTLKKLTENQGELRLIEPLSNAHSVMSVTYTLNIFKMYKSVEEALLSFDEMICIQ
jgi:anti-anti-sigma factor